MSGSSHIRGVLIGIEYQIVVELLLFIYFLDWANSIKPDLHICNLWTGQFVICYLDGANSIKTD
jgi:hypothetical protein